MTSVSERDPVVVGVKRTLRKSQVDWYLRQIEGLYQNWFLTDKFANRQIAGIEARLIR